jgi:hypothetical protein
MAMEIVLVLTPVIPVGLNEDKNRGGGGIGDRSSGVGVSGIGIFGGHAGDQL